MGNDGMGSFSSFCMNLKEVEIGFTNKIPVVVWSLFGLLMVQWTCFRFFFWIANSLLLGKSTLKSKRADFFSFLYGQLGLRRSNQVLRWDSFYTTNVRWSAEAAKKPSWRSADLGSPSGCRIWRFQNFHPRNPATFRETFSIYNIYIYDYMFFVFECQIWHIYHIKLPEADKTNYCWWWFEILHLGSTEPVGK